MDRGSRLDQLIGNLIQHKTLVLSEDDPLGDVSLLCREVSRVLLDDPSLLELTPPLNICGDLHGQFNDLLRVLHTGNFNPSTKYLFLGDYVDRGDQSLEIICLLFAMKIRFPNNIYLLRGNHESPEMTYCFGFVDECIRKLKRESICECFFNAFDCMPIAALVGGRIFCVHGGLSPSLDNVHEINEIARPTAIPDDGILSDLLWSDPSPFTEIWGPNDRGATYTWGLRVAEDFMARNGLDRIIRAHEVAQEGYAFPFAPNQSVITVFTASAYANRYTNKAAFITVDGNLELSYTVLDPVIADREVYKRPATPRFQETTIEEQEEEEEEEIYNTL